MRSRFGVAMVGMAEACRGRRSRGRRRRGSRSSGASLAVAPRAGAAEADERAESGEHSRARCSISDHSPRRVRRRSRHRRAVLRARSMNSCASCDVRRRPGTRSCANVCICARQSSSHLRMLRGDVESLRGSTSRSKSSASIFTAGSTSNAASDRPSAADPLERGQVDRHRSAARVRRRGGGSFAVLPLPLADRFEQGALEVVEGAVVVEGATFEQREETAAVERRLAGRRRLPASSRKRGHQIERAGELGADLTGGIRPGQRAMHGTRMPPS